MLQPGKQAAVPFSAFIVVCTCTVTNTSLVRLLHMDKLRVDPLAAAIGR